MAALANKTTAVDESVYDYCNWDQCGLSNKNKNENEKGKSILTFGQTLWRGRRCYFRLLTHIMNQATDIDVAIEFYRISQQEGLNECDDVRPFVLFIASILFIILHRVVTAFCLYSLTFRLDYIILQLFDVLILQSIVVNTVLLNNSITIKNNENENENNNSNKSKVKIKIKMRIKFLFVNHNC